MISSDDGRIRISRNGKSPVPELQRNTQVVSVFISGPASVQKFVFFASVFGFIAHVKLLNVIIKIDTQHFFLENEFDCIKDVNEW